jgi:hypothetical protein
MEKRRWRQPQQKESHRKNGAVGRDDDTVEIVGKSAKGIGGKEGARDGGNEVLGVGKKKKNKILKRTEGGELCTAQMAPFQELAIIMEQSKFHAHLNIPS